MVEENGGEDESEVESEDSQYSEFSESEEEEV